MLLYKWSIFKDIFKFLFLKLLDENFQCARCLFSICSSFRPIVFNEHCSVVVANELEDVPFSLRRQVVFFVGFHRMWRICSLILCFYVGFIYLLHLKWNPLLQYYTLCQWCNCVIANITDKAIRLMASCTIESRQHRLPELLRCIQCLSMLEFCTLSADGQIAYL